MSSVPLQKKTARRHLPAVLPPLMAWLLVVTLSFAAFQASRTAEANQIRSAFSALAEDHMQRVRDHVEVSLQLTAVLEIFWLSSEEVRWDEYLRFTGHLLTKDGSVLALVWAPRVQFEVVSEFEAGAQEILPGYRIKQWTPSGNLEPGTARDHMFPVKYVAPFERNGKLVGFDFGSERSRRDALYNARDRSDPVVTPPLQLVSREDDLTGFLYVWPIYDRTKKVTNEQERRDHLQGFLIGVYSMREIVDRALATMESTDLVLHVLLRDTLDRQTVVHTFGGLPSRYATGSEFVRPAERDLVMSQQLSADTPGWYLVCLTGPDYIANRRTWFPWTFLLSGLVVATLLASLLALKHSRASALGQANILLRAQIRDREAAEEALRENQRRLATLMSNLPGAAYRARPEPERPLEFLSEGCEQLTGFRREDFLSGEVHYLRDLVHADDQERFRKELESSVSERRPYRMEYRIRDAGGFEKWIWEQGRPVAGVDGGVVALEGFLSDVTPAKEAQFQKERMEESLRETQKLESLGILAGGIAHDFNNLLTGVLGNAEVAQEMLGPKDPAREPLQQLLHAGRRAQQLTAQLLAYAGRASLEREAVDLSAHLREMLDLLQTAIPKKVELRFNLQDHLPSVEADPAQLQQLAMNLVLNAAEACDDDPGTVRVSTRLLKREALTLPSGAHPDGPVVLLEVRDDGTGMDASTRQRMFEPFFTTKFTGRGLGLSAVLGIVRAHGGHLEVSSAPGSGTTVSVYLPASDKRPVARAPAPDEDLRGQGGLLLVDDEPLVLDVAQRILDRLGYAIHACTDADEALEWYRANWQSTDAVILDMTMPGMNGREMLQAMRQVNPGVRALIASGYLESEVADRFESEAPCAFVQKPFSRQSLGGTLKDVLGQPGPTGRADAS